MGESGGASKIGSSWPWSEHCLWVGLLTWPGFGAAPVASAITGGPWFAVELHAAEVLEAVTLLGLREDKLLVVAFWWDGAAVSAVGRAHVEVPLRLTEPDFTKGKPPLSWEAVLMGRNTQQVMFFVFYWYEVQIFQTVISCCHLEPLCKPRAALTLQSCGSIMLFIHKKCGVGALTFLGFWGVHDRKKIEIHCSMVII